MKKENRLTRSNDFKLIKDAGKSIYDSLAVLVYTPNQSSKSRAAVVASKAVGNAVIRNRAKRRIKARLDNRWKKVNPGWDFIFYARAAIVDAAIKEIDLTIDHLLRKAGVLDEENNNNVC